MLGQKPHIPYYSCLSGLIVSNVPKPSFIHLDNIVSILSFAEHIICCAAWSGTDIVIPVEL